MGLRIEDLIRCVVGIGGLELEWLDRTARAGPVQRTGLDVRGVWEYLRLVRFFSFSFAEEAEHQTKQVGM